MDFARKNQFPYSSIRYIIHRCDEQFVFRLWYLWWPYIEKSQLKWCRKICWALPLPLQWHSLGSHMGIHIFYISLCIGIYWSSHLVLSILYPRRHIWKKFIAVEDSNGKKTRSVESDIPNRLCFDAYSTLYPQGVPEKKCCSTVFKCKEDKINTAGKFGQFLMFQNSEHSG